MPGTLKRCPMFQYKFPRFSIQWCGHLDNAMRLSMPAFKYRFYGVTFGQYGFGLITRNRRPKIEELKKG